MLLEYGVWQWGTARLDNVLFLDLNDGHIDHFVDIRQAVCSIIGHFYFNRILIF